MTKTKALCIGDVHGRLRAVEAAETFAATHHLVFLGDLIDTRENLSPALQEACLRKVLKIVERGDGDCIFGNHELSYLFPSYMRASGYTMANASFVNTLKGAMFKNFRPLLAWPDANLIVSHAGFTQGYWDYHKLDINTIEEQSYAWFRDPLSPLFQVGVCRGGIAPYGGPYWCDWDWEFEPITGIAQIVGHTAARKGDANPIRKHGNNWCIDCLAALPLALEWDFETNTAKEVPLY